MDKRKVIPVKTVSHDGVTLTSDTHGTVTIEVPGQPHMKLTSSEYLRLADLLGHMYEWEDL